MNLSQLNQSDKDKKIIYILFLRNYIRLHYIIYLFGLAHFKQAENEETQYDYKKGIFFKELFIEIRKAAYSN